MSIQDVTVFRREITGKEEAGRLRRSGMTPCVVYGLDADPVAVSAEPKLINRILHSEKGFNSVLNLRLEGTEHSRHVMIKMVDRHPVTDRLVHIDFIRINMDENVQRTIPIEVTGTPEGVKQGGVMAIVRHEVGVECLPKDIPARIEVDASGVGMDQALRIGDLPQLDGVTYLLGPKRVVAVVNPPDSQSTVTDEDDEDNA